MLRAIAGLSWAGLPILPWLLQGEAADAALLSRAAPAPSLSPAHPFDLRQLQAPPELLQEARSAVLDEFRLNAEQLQVLDAVAGWLQPAASCPSASSPVVLVHGAFGSGKCFARGTLLRLYSGDVIAVERIVGGERLMGDDGRPRIVTPGSLTPPGSRGVLYTVTPHWEGAEAFTVNGEHILVLSNCVRPWMQRTARPGQLPVYQYQALWFELDSANVLRLRQRSYAAEQRALDDVGSLSVDWAPLEWEVSVRDFLAASIRVRRACRLMAADAVTFHNPQLPRLADVLGITLGHAPTAAQVGWTAWFLGLWLTDGVAAYADICLGGQPSGQCGSHWEIRAELLRYELLFGEPVTLLWQSCKPGVRGGSAASVAHRLLQQYGLLNHQHVPQAWLCDSLDVRRRILAGIVDGAGCRSDSCSNCYEISVSQLRLAQGYKLLGASLGLRTGAISLRTTADKWTGQVCDGHRLQVSGHVQTVSLHIVCSSKQSPQPGAADYVAPSPDSRYYGFRVRQQAAGDYFGFAVHGGCNRRFLLADFTITHNVRAQQDSRPRSLWQRAELCLCLCCVRLDEPAGGAGGIPAPRAVSGGPGRSRAAAGGRADQRGRGQRPVCSAAPRPRLLRPRRQHAPHRRQYPPLHASRAGGRRRRQRSGGSAQAGHC